MFRAVHDESEDAPERRPLFVMCVTAVLRETCRARLTQATPLDRKTDIDVRSSPSRSTSINGSADRPRSFPLLVAAGPAQHLDRPPGFSTDVPC
jgi:hypothetical protein